jgi:hypothetical protein
MSKCERTRTNMILYTFTVDHVCNSETTLRSSGEERKERRMIEWTILGSVTSLQVEDIRTGAENC